MIDTMTKKPLRVTRAGTARAFIRLPESQLVELCGLLDKNYIRYWVDGHAISFDGEPETTLVHFGRNVDVAAIQTILDDVR